MNVRSTALLVAAGLGIVLTASQPAAAFTVPPTMKASTVAEEVVCRATRSRIVLPGGRVIYRNVRTCSASVVRPVPRCDARTDRAPQWYCHFPQRSPLRLSLLWTMGAHHANSGTASRA